MQISSRFTIAIHMLACIDTFQNEIKVTSDFLAESIRVNPVIIRKLLSELKTAGMIDVKRGTGGTTLAKPLEEITFYDIYDIAEREENKNIFHFHKNPNPDCPVGRNIHGVLDDKLYRVQCAMEQEMKLITMADVKDDLLKLMTNE